MKSVVIIPARFKSSRFPGKPLTPLLGKQMILWVAKLSAQAVGRENVYVATDDKRIADIVNSNGYLAVMTDDKCLTGTDRVAEAAKQIEADIYINVQGDEPTLNPNDIIKVIEVKKQEMDAVINGFCWIMKTENVDNINIPKVITNERNELVYISRKALPGFKEQKNAPNHFKKQVCIYAFDYEQLEAFYRFGRKSFLEQCEDIEILRFLELNMPIKMVQTSSGSLAVDIPEDISQVEAALKRIHNL
ncbi:MAG: 3-deoxy-manno-octulosonate cytidylyltransferase [Campylobacteraceae bacterium]|jgi:3-deoxy-manno-octulosonate cytidylyltransferase (CMP-KDO synthetase)|nr:3-deoxy-manno-octulosonate cytidylyltransferase [Campylobacteraceae bacterium]